MKKMILFLSVLNLGLAQAGLDGKISRCDKSLIPPSDFEPYEVHTYEVEGSAIEGDSAKKLFQKLPLWHTDQDVYGNTYLEEAGQGISTVFVKEEGDYRYFVSEKQYCRHVGTSYFCSRLCYASGQETCPG